MAKAKQDAKANAKTRQATAANKAKKSDPVETPETKDIAVVEEKPKTVEEFKPMCGFEFDPAQAGACFKTCQGENPEAFTACQDNFKTAVKKSAGSASKTMRGKNVWGHLNGCQGALIDEAFLVKGGAHSMKELMKAAGATQARVLSHLKHLVSVWNVDLRITEEKKYFIKGNKSDGLVGLKHNGAKVIETPKAA